MAIGIENFPNIDTTDPTNYPNGQIKDDPAGVAGTPANNLTVNDLFLTFDKMLRLAGITASGDPDNETNGYQYIQALLEITNGGSWKTSGLTFQTVSGVLWANSGAPHYNASYIKSGNTVFLAGAITGSIAIGQPVVLNLPAAIRPASTVRVCARYFKTGSSTFETRNIYLQSNGDLAIETDEAATGVVLYLDGITYRLV